MTNCANIAVSFAHKAFKVYLCNFIEAFLATGLDCWHCCAGLLRLPSDVCFVLFCSQVPCGVGHNFPLGAGAMVFALAGFGRSGGCVLGLRGR